MAGSLPLNNQGSSQHTLAKVFGKLSELLFKDPLLIAAQAVLEQAGDDLTNPDTNLPSSISSSGLLGLWFNHPDPHGGVLQPHDQLIPEERMSGKVIKRWHDHMVYLSPLQFIRRLVERAVAPWLVLVTSLGETEALSFGELRQATFQLLELVVFKLFHDPHIAVDLGLHGWFSVLL